MGGKYGVEAGKEIIKACPRVMNCFDLQFCADGSVVPCCFDFNRHDVIGNVRDNTIEDILNGEVIERMRKIHRFGNISISKLMCRNCD